MKVIVEKLKENAKIPTQAKPADFCYDVYATSRRHVDWRKWEYGIGLAFEIVRGPENIIPLVNPFHSQFPSPKEFLNFDLKESPIKLSIDFRPRSSVWKTGLTLCNCEGTIDELYRGEVKAYFYTTTIFGKKYKVGDRIGQIKIGATVPIEFIEGKVNKNTARGEGGFGSTGR